MKNTLLLAIIASCFIGTAQDSIGVKLANWKNNKKAAVVFTFDDWSPGHGELVVPMFIKHNTPATFFVTTKNKDLGGSWERMKLAYANGCEIGNHTCNHPDLTQLSKKHLKMEVAETQKMLRDSVHPKVANTIAFPYGTCNAEVKKFVQDEHIGARLAGLRYGRMWPYSLTLGKTDYFEIQTFMARDIHVPKTIKRIANQAVGQGGMVTLMYHSIYNDTVNDHWFGAIHESMLEAHLKAIKSIDSVVWITTFEAAIQYHKEKKNTTLSWKKEGDSIVINSDCSLDSAQFFYPLTFQVSGVKVSEIEGVWINGQVLNQLDYWNDDQSGLLTFNSLPFKSQIRIKLKR